MHDVCPAGARPPASAVTAFALAGSPEPLAGGEYTAWRVGDLVLKPVGVPVVDGWHATTFLPGRSVHGRWLDIVEVGEVFHAAIASVRRPAFMDDRPIRGRSATGSPGMNCPVEDVPETKHLLRLVDHLRPIIAPPQLIHGDLTGNVLFDDDLPPAVIDLSPYFRPPAFASAVVVADALVWKGRGRIAPASVGSGCRVPAVLLRALIYRAVTDRLFRLDQPLRPDSDDPYRSAVDLAIAASLT